MGAPPTLRDSPAGTAGSSRVGRWQWFALLLVFVAVIATDQVAKWLAWRHLGGTLINDGGQFWLGRTIRGWFADPVQGAVANVIGVLLIGAGVAWLMRRARSPAVLVGTGLVAAGWTSNLLDRFGVHRVSAPGSRRGVVDFIPSGGVSRCNVADIWIVLGVLLLLGVAVNAVCRRHAVSPQA
jgi:lipoprotein signal peptidase